VLLVLGLTSCAAPAVELARVEGFGPVSRGMAGGGVAYAVGASALMLNPAELLSLDSAREFNVQVTQINARVPMKNLDSGETAHNANVGLNRSPYYLPELAYATRNGEWAYGIGLFAAGGFGVEYENDTYLSHTTTGGLDTGLTQSTRLSLLRVPLALAWQPHPRWRLGAGLELLSCSVNLAALLDAQQVRGLIQSGRMSGNLVPMLGLLQPTLAGAHVEFLRDNPVNSKLEAWGIAGRVGISFQATPDTALAFAYETRSYLDDLKGDGNLSAITRLNTRIVLSGEGRLPEFQFPQGFVLGISHQVQDHLALTMDLRRMFWRQVAGDTVVAFRTDRGNGDLRVSLPTGFNNLTTLTLGSEWQAQPKLLLRFGASHAFADTVPGSKLSGAFPTLTRNHLTTGFSWWTGGVHQWDVSLTYGFTNSVRNPGDNLSSVPSLKATNRQFNPALSYTYRF
jgi:long-chain fatty acid transport protein